MPIGRRTWMGLLAGLLATAAAGQERAPRPTPCPADASGAEVSVGDVLLGADLAAATHDEEKAGDLLAEAAERAPGELAPPDWLILARRDESRGNFASAAARYGRYLRSVEGSEEDKRWVGPRLRQLNIAAQANAPAAPGAHVPPAEARLALADGRAALARIDSKAAREKFGIALRLDAGYAEAALAAGALDAREGRAADAVREYRLALAADPERVDAMVPLANLLWQGSDRVAKAESLVLLDRAAAQRSDLPTLQRRSAERWAEWGDPRAALERLDAWRALVSPSQRKETDRLREELASRSPQAPPSEPIRADAETGSRKVDRPAARSVSAASTSAGSSAWFWVAGVAVLAAIGAAVGVYRRRSTALQPIGPAPTTTLVNAEELRRILESVASEQHLAAPTMTTKGFPEEGKPSWVVRIPPHDWEAIWRTAFGQAISAPRSTPGLAPRLALFGSLVRDSKVAPVAVRFALADNAPGPLATEMIHGPAAKGEWRAVDERIRANGGSIAVAASIDRQFTKRLIIELCALEG